MGIMTANQAAEKWGITPRRVNEIIRSGRIKGVYKIGTSWVMPDDTPKPPDLRVERKGKARNYKILPPKSGDGDKGESV